MVILRFLQRSQAVCKMLKARRQRIHTQKKLIHEAIAHERQFSLSVLQILPFLFRFRRLLRRRLKDRKDKTVMAGRISRVTACTLIQQWLHRCAHFCRDRKKPSMSSQQRFHRKRAVVEIQKYLRWHHSCILVEEVWCFVRAARLLQRVGRGLTRRRKASAEMAIRSRGPVQGWHTYSDNSSMRAKAPPSKHNANLNRTPPSEALKQINLRASYLLNNNRPKYSNPSELSLYRLYHCFTGKSQSSRRERADRPMVVSSRPASAMENTYWAMKRLLRRNNEESGDASSIVSTLRQARALVENPRPQTLQDQNGTQPRAQSAGLIRRNVLVSPLIPQRVKKNW